MCFRLTTILTWSVKLIEPFTTDVGPFAMAPEEKQAFLSERLAALVEHHHARCAPYARLVDDWRGRTTSGSFSVESCPYVPVTAFKNYDLRSTDESGTTLQSSATTSAVASKIFADKATKKRQALSANKILTDFVGSEKRPYLVFDLEATVRGAGAMSARAAAILGLAHLATEFLFVMREEKGQLRIDRDALEHAIEVIGDGPFLSYGFTYILYQAHRELAELGITLPRAHPDSRFLHSGGWKRLVALAVDKPTFNRTISEPWQLEPASVVDFYGVIEQAGVPYPDCSAGYKHAPYWAEVVIRQNDSMQPTKTGETGLIQLINCLPLSAPNHSVLTEDLGQIVLDDGCACGRRGKAFIFKGRAPRSETRGCSDVPRR